ncbi:MAG TPA: tripartite tricarboxylate transporter substrate binding protein [Thermodesulfobacteriota bacterium]|nr:tripartite tricarboxylate transporter substrate binding protein [Thermodesulfobacteriota bacterium]
MVKKEFTKGFASFVAGLVFLLCSQTVPAKEYPTKPITLVVPSGPGSATDLLMRAVTSVAADYLGQPIIVKLVPGGGGAIGCELAAKAPSDGYTLLAGSSSWSTGLPAIEGRSRGLEDFIPVCRINYSPTILIARVDAPFKTFKQMMEWVKGNPGKMTVSSPGPWTPPDVVWKYLMKITGSSFKIVPFQGGGDATVALLGGHVDAGTAIPSMAMPYKGTGKMTFLLLLDEKRHPDFPDVPTSAEENLDRVINTLGCAWRGILVPKGTSAAVVESLAMGFKKMTEDKSVQSLLQKSGEKIYYLGPDEFRKVWESEYHAYKELGKLYKK